MTLITQAHVEKEPSIFNFTTNKIQTSDKEIQIIAKFDEPLVVVFDHVLSNDECDRLISISKDKLQRSKIGSARELSDVRTSSGTFLDSHADTTIITIEKRIAELTGIPYEHGEGLHILNYLPGQEYKAHFDYFSKTSKAATNNRIATLVLYLNDVEEGGETYFPQLNLSIFPKKGMAVYFEYFYSNEHLNELTLHGGAPVLEGEKWIATQWMRKQKITK